MKDHRDLVELMTERAQRKLAEVKSQTFGFFFWGGVSYVVPLWLIGGDLHGWKFTAACIGWAAIVGLLAWNNYTDQRDAPWQPGKDRLLTKDRVIHGEVYETLRHVDEAGFEAILAILRNPHSRFAQKEAYGLIRDQILGSEQSWRDSVRASREAVIPLPPADFAR